MSPADQALVRHVERVRHQRLVDWGVRPGPTKRARLFGFLYEWGLIAFGFVLAMCVGIRW